ncbi:hypothetical protein [Actinoplanes sp. NPDC089786]
MVPRRWSAGRAYPLRAAHPTVAEIRCSHCGELLHAADTDVTPLR